MILVIDNYDSFTFNVVQALECVTSEEIKVVRNDEVTLDQIAAMEPSKLIVSPGPGNPTSAGVSIDAIKFFAGKIPILGICLGHQAIGEAFGAKIVGAKFIKHGIVEDIDLDGRGIFRTIGKSAKFTRYHSLVIEESTLSSDFEVTARAKDGDIMGIRHKTMPIEGVQFHPESIASQACQELFKAFLNYRRDNLPVADYLKQLIDDKKPLSAQQASFFMENLTDGTMDEKVTSSILTAMASRGLPTADEMAGCAGALLKKKTPFPLENHGLAEIVGTGGDGKGSFNISSLSALVAASCGQPVAKHGNRAVSSKSGAADFFENLGIKIMAEPQNTANLVKQTGFGFLMAPVYHAAMRFAAPVRKALGIKTIFNVLGPLLNPANAEYEVLGVYSADLMEDYARAAKALGAKRVMVIHSRDGFDEISPCEPTDVFQINDDGKEYRYTIEPAKFGIGGAGGIAVNADELEGGSGADNAKLAMDVLNGKGRATIRAAVGLNAGAVLYLSGKAKTLKDGFDMAVNAMDSGKTLAKLKEIQKTSEQLSA
ncbi:bifunctional anthranilate synthase component II/anthranilate phosphoribosyltransferase [Treponema sp.]|uniref:bifunctional anthranilate synthase component II/anthranilate phosphoribosyltransferase n=1 Tax=Treponema sp. TaxID=166 RepID=UPI00298DFB2A|nr:bifunctional anthranilate synthase component II/anthranilate phosphoribosyltransferase [Treponema sp.]MCR5612059.1 bifunctional anthranilate synthase component II/anthranilate phosphoribosyltransferase [Treponema sp.]